MTLQTILIVGAIIAVIGGISYFIGKWKAKKLIEGGKIIGKSKEKDKDREDATTKTDDQIKENEDVIKESEDAIKRAEDVLREAKEKVRKLREKNSSNNSSTPTSS